MKYVVLCSALLLSGFLSIAQITINDPNAEKRALGSFHGIEVATGIELTLTQGALEDVAVSASSPAYRDKIITRVENGILKIYYETKSGAINKKHETKGLKAYVSCKTLDRLYATTGAEVEILGVLTGKDLDMKANTGAEIRGKVELASLDLDQNTGSRVTLSGRSAKLLAEGSTGSKFTGEDMYTENCNVKVSTGAKLSIRAEKELQVRASTGGVVRYSGNAGIREIKTNTGGTVSRI